MSNGMQRKFARATSAVLISLSFAASAPAFAQAAPGFHFEDICRSDPAASKNTVTVFLHGPDDLDAGGSYVQSHTPLAGITINVLWTYVDYRQNHAVFRYQPDSCVTARDGSCTFHGGSKRARWQLSEVVGYDLSSPAFDMPATTVCPNTLMIDFW
jgi:hypothetical protein